MGNQQVRGYQDIFKSVYDDYAVSKIGVVLSKTGKPLAQHDNGRGYLIVSLQINGKRTSKAVHRLVAEAWIPNPLNLKEVNHIDCNRVNNVIENLEWCSHGYNVKYSYLRKNRTAVGEHNARCKTSTEVVTEICKLLQTGFKSYEIRDKGYDYALVRGIKCRRSWNHISVNFTW